VRIRWEVIVELERLRGRRASWLVGHARVQQERRRMLHRTGFTVRKTGRVRVVPIKSLEFHRRQLKRPERYR